VEEGQDFMELLELQGNLRMITKSELLERVRLKGYPISERRLTSLVSEGLLPKSARIGSRSGAYPAITEELLRFILKARGRGLSVQAIREVLPVWRFLKAACRDGRLSLLEFEYLARQHAQSEEAAWAMPAVLTDVLPCPSCSADDLERIEFIDKQGNVMDHTPGVSIGFALALETEPGQAKVVSRTRVVLAVGCGEDPQTVVVGAPNGVRVDFGETEIAGEGSAEEPVRTGREGA
jgi:DNA-binding transcriptional MerR regulator